MTNRRLVVAVLTTLCLISTMFMIIPTRSQTGIGGYDPWVDLNDDGWVDIYDAITLANHFGTSGTPINKTDLLLDLLARMESLNATIIQQQNTINNLNNTVIELQNTTDYLNTTVNYLNQTIVILNSTQGLGPPDYDSGVIATPRGYTDVQHNLGTMRLMVYLVGISDEGYVHHINYGGAVIDQYGTKRGAHWILLNNDTIRIVVENHMDNYMWTHSRIMIWKIP